MYLPSFTIYLNNQISYKSEISPEGLEGAYTQPILILN